MNDGLTPYGLLGGGGGGGGMLTITDDLNMSGTA